MGDILKEAIADAKAVRETALENAKMALEEAFTPQLKSMLSAKLKEDEFGDEEEVPVADEDDEFGGEEEVPAEEGTYEDEEFGDEEPVAGLEEPDMEEEGVIEINGVKYAPVVSEDEMEAPVDVADDDEEDSLDLEAVIRELESELSEGEEEDTVEEQDDAYDEAGSKQDQNDGKSGSTLAEEDDAYDDSPNKEDKNDGVKSSDLAEGEDSDEDDVEVDESIFSEQEDEEELEEVDKSSGIGTSDNSVADTDKESGIGNGDNTLKEYKEAVKFLKDKLHEVNILNAKLLFTNKLFKQYSLDNNQKLKVVETFDRAQTTREIKLVYSTLAEQFSDNGSIVTKKSINESASSAVGSTKPSKQSRKVISEEQQVANRFKKLAGLIK